MKIILRTASRSCNDVDLLQVNQCGGIYEANGAMEQMICRLEEMHLLNLYQAALTIGTQYYFWWSRDTEFVESI